MSSSPIDQKALWRALANGDAAARETLLKEHLSLVHHVARQLSRSLAAPADFDELVSCGTIGLMSALDAFDVSRGLAFSTFAVPRIRGAILDELRRQDHVPRSIRRKTREIAAARENLTRIFGRTSITGIFAPRTTFSATLPSSQRSMPLRPCVLITIKSASVSSA